jgi:hypothetical protein
MDAAPLSDLEVARPGVLRNFGRPAGSEARPARLDELGMEPPVSHEIMVTLARTRRGRRGVLRHGLGRSGDRHDVIMAACWPRSAACSCPGFCSVRESKRIRGSRTLPATAYEAGLPLLVTELDSYETAA